MLRSLAFAKVASGILLATLPFTAVGCRTAGGGWGWTPSWPSTSMASLNPWKPSSSTDQLATSKPSNQVPVPPAAMLAGSGLARNGQNGGISAGGPNSTAHNHGGRPSGAYTASNNEYGTRQVSATQNEGGYNTGPYSMGAGGTAQQGPYGAGATATANGGNAGGPYGAAASTADRRSDSSYGQGSNSSGANNWGGQGYNSSPNAQPSTGAYPSTPSGTNYPSTANPGYRGAAAESPYTGSVGVAAGANHNHAAGLATASSEPYRPGSTARGGDVQRTSYENSNSAEPAASTASATADGGYPSTPAGDDSTYR